MEHNEDTVATVDEPNNAKIIELAGKAAIIATALVELGKIVKETVQILAKR